MHAHPDLHTALAADQQRHLLAEAAAERVRLDQRLKRAGADYDRLISEKRMTVTMSSAPIGRL
jgi:hypothetical protein